MNVRTERAVRSTTLPEPLEVRAARAFAEHGLDYAGPLPEPGRTVRVPDVGKGARNRACAITRTADAVLVYGHASGIGFAVREDGRDAVLTRAERQRVQVDAERAARAARTDEAARQRRAITRARIEYADAVPCLGHAYLTAKGVRSVPGLRVDAGGRLLVPRRHVSGRFVGLQRIEVDGTKRYSAGTPTSATFFGIGGPVAAEGIVLIAEGLATGLTVAEETGHPVACAFDTGNLKPVARALRTEYPRVDIVIAADDDRQTVENPGRTKALEAARAVGGRVLLPRLCRCCTCTDFNDASACARRRGAL